MKFTIQLEREGGVEALVVGQIERAMPLQAGTLGLTLAEAKAVLAELQQVVVQSQLHDHAGTGSVPTLIHYLLSSNYGQTTEIGLCRCFVQEIGVIA